MTTPCGDSSARLREREELLGQFIEHAPAALAMFDHRMCYLATSRRWRETYGRGNQEVPGTCHYDVFPEIGPGWREVHRRGLGGEVLRAEEDCFERADGVVQWLRWEVRPWYRAGGDVGGIMILSEDISERHENALMLRLQARRAEAMLAMPREAEAQGEAGLMQVGLEAAEDLTDSHVGFIRFLHDSSAGGERMAWSRRDVDEDGNVTLQRFCPLDGGRAWAHVLRDTAPLTINDAPALAERLHGGQDYPAFTRLSTVPVLEEGRVVMVLGVGNKSQNYTPMDVETLRLMAEQIWHLVQRRRTEAELRQHRDHLETLVQTRTTQLEEARQRAEEANRAKSAFLANMTHEIRTPLNAIVGLVHLLRTGEKAAGQDEKLQKVDSAAKHLLSIISDILDISKIEAGRFVLETRDFHLSAVLDHVASVISEAAQAKGLLLETDAESVPQWLRGDPARLRQALLNLAGNAIKFTEHGSIHLHARLMGEDAHGLRVRFEVRDTGVGIAAEHRNQLFEAFRQADTSITRRYGGTGLGLVVTRRLAELMNGSVGLESEEGQGSLFWFEVALERSRGERAQPVRFPLLAPAPGPAPEDFKAHAGARVLVVEDNPINREVALELLQRVGLVVDTAEDGRAALAMARGVHYDLILMDVQMPRMDGLTATRRMRALPQGGNTPILAMTANVFAEDRLAALEAGMNDFIPKPVEPDALYRVLLRWLGDKDIAAHSSPSGATPPASGYETGGHVHGFRMPRGLEVDTARRLDSARLVPLFLEYHQEDANKLREMGARGDWQGVKRRAHSLKGAAGNLGVGRIATMARSLEKVGGDPGSLEDFIGLCEQLQVELDQLVREVEGEHRTSESGRAVAVGLSADEARTVLRRMEALLACDDTAVIDLFEQYRETLAPHLGGRYSALTRSVEGFDYPGALSIVRLCRQALS
ncbi:MULTISPECIES: response regulator [unclassified Ectothiorhodospira]|uniref:response regulator n=1 Tax=unclassified Ectothiorhodospira TaxID=2684909 RepID=UPI001EE971CB|nr:MULTISPECIES: response regulator [unclassified Ectothiorhodospira]MCG5516988.1 response regulator [Ectothiorhodospira sp. 9100]MCG5519864.1 response regulator [Ectothiorhodospira sp. 9905]